MWPLPLFPHLIQQFSLSLYYTHTHTHTHIHTQTHTHTPHTHTHTYTHTHTTHRGYQSYLNYHQIEASAGGRALQCQVPRPTIIQQCKLLSHSSAQEGQPIPPQDLESALTRERIFYVQVTIAIPLCKAM